MQFRHLCRQAIEISRSVCGTHRGGQASSLLLVVVFGIGTSVARAESTSNSVSEVGGTPVYEEIVVTARFREETVQDIGGAVSALDLTSKTSRHVFRG